MSIFFLFFSFHALFSSVEVPQILLNSWSNRRRRVDLEPINPWDIRGIGWLWLKVRVAVEEEMGHRGPKESAVNVEMAAGRWGVDVAALGAEKLHGALP